MKQFARKYRLVIGDQDVSNLDFEFHVKRNSKPTPNTCALKVYNMSEQRRLLLEASPGQGVSGKKHKGPKGEPKAIAAKSLPVVLEAGYADAIGQIYLGNVRSGQSTSEGADIITQVSTGDSEKEIQEARINVPIGPGTPVDVVLDNIATALGVGKGNVDQTAANLKKNGIVTLHPTGTVLSGSASQMMTDFCRSAGLEWSIQNGQIQILDVGAPLRHDKAVEISAKTGMIGSPALDSAGYVNVEVLMNPDIRPGALISLDSRHIQGGYVVTALEYIGATFGGVNSPWYIKVTGQKY